MKLKNTRFCVAITLLSSMFLTLSSCDKKEDDKVTRLPRLKQMEYTYSDDYSASADTSIVLFYYNDKNLLIAMAGANDPDSISFQYSPEGKITKMEMHDVSGVDLSIDCLWAGSTMTMTESDSPGAKVVFEMNAEGRIARMDSYSLVQQQWIQRHYQIYNWQNNNLVSTELWDTFDNGNKHNTFNPGSLSAIFSFLRSQIKSDFTGSERQNFYKSVETTYTYDDKNNPYKDVQIYQFSEVGYYSSKNNAISYTSKVFTTTGGIDGTYSTSFNFTYNQDNFPTERAEIYNDWSTREAYLYE